MGESFVLFTEYTQLQVFAIALTLMIGTAGLLHIIMHFYAVPSASGARLSAGMRSFSSRCST